jgi:DNA polymerase-3 subunit gamma/tau
MSTLYRDYRPQKFSEVLGQSHIKITLQNEIVAGRLAQALLFCGPRAVGKTTLARVLAKAINCEQRSSEDFEPCNNCASCRSITAGKNLDVVEIDAASNTGVDNVRENIIAFSRLAPAQAKYKVFIIDEVHMLSISAFNALLKIIEEPPAYVIFILCTTEIQRVPNTVISRCERFDFRRISIKEIVKKLSFIAVQEKVEIAPSILESVARRSGGHLRDAESLLGQIFSLGGQQITSEQAELVVPNYNSNDALSLIDFLGHKDAAKAVALINSLADSGVNMKILVSEIVNLLRKIMLEKLSPELIDSLGLDLGENLEKRLSAISAELNWESVLLFTRRFLEIANDNRVATIPQLPLELAVVELCLGTAVVTTKNEPESPRALPSLSKLTTRNRLPESPESTVTEPLASEATANSRPRISELSAAAVKERWPEFLVKIKKYNHSLSFVLQNCEPGDITAGRLSLVFKYKFHQDRINDAGIKKIVEEALAETFGAGIGFQSTIDENLDMHRTNQSVETSSVTAASPVSPATPAETVEPLKPVSESQAANLSGGLMNDLLKTFGGEIIN